MECENCYADSPELTPVFLRISEKGWMPKTFYSQEITNLCPECLKTRVRRANRAEGGSHG
jgi:hypothetical protein